MGLRINTNVPAITALRTLGIDNRNQATSLERLSTGLRINRGSDDPSGMVISEQLRSQLKDLNQAVENSQNATNLINVADSALGNVSDMLVQIQNSIVFAQNTGGASPAQIAAEQDAVDAAISAVDRIAATTRYADRPLLNGNASFQTSASLPSFFNNLNLKSVTFPGTSFTTGLGVTPTINPQRATLQILGAAAGANGATIRVSGPRGTQTVLLAGAATAAQIAGGINTVSGFTGVFASGTSDGNVVMRTEDFGSNQFIKVEGVAGSITGTGFQNLTDGTTASPSGTYAAIPGLVSPFSQGNIMSDRGQNGQVTFNGQAYTGVGRHFNIQSLTATFSFDENPDLLTLDNSAASALPALPAGAPFTVTVANTGLNFQLRELPQPTDQMAIGINSVSAGVVGATTFRDRIAEAGGSFATQVIKGGFLASIKTGAGNDLFQNPGNASAIVRAATDQVSGLRGFLGAAQADAIQPNIDSLGVEIQSVSSSLSTLRDLDFAAETANFTRNQILFQAGIAALGQADTVPQSVLTLLQRL